MRGFASFAAPLALAAAGLGGCTVGPDYRPPALPAGITASSGFLRGGDTQADAPASRWWEGLNDASLTSLIDRGLAAAPSVAEASARVRQARAQAAQSRAATLPNIAGSALYVHANLPEGAFGTEPGGDNLFNLGFDAQWEIDLWGGGRRTVERSLAEAEAGGARLADAQVSLSADIARCYIELRDREATLVLLDRRHAIEIRLADYARERFQGGTASREALEQAQLQVARTEASRAARSAELTVFRDELAMLVGGVPGELDRLPAGYVPLPPAHVAVGDPADMLRRRPDVRAAERELAASTAQIGVATARRFPSVSLLGLIGIGGTDAGDIFDLSQISSIAVPRLSWSFLDFGRTAAAKRGAEAARDAALAAYRQATLGALRDTENALARYGAARVALGYAVDETDHVARFAGLERQRASGGSASTVDALGAERLEVDQQLAQSDSRAQLALAYIAVMKALGLGWQAAPNS